MRLCSKSFINLSRQIRLGSVKLVAGKNLFLDPQQERRVNWTTPAPRGQNSSLVSPYSGFLFSVKIIPSAEDLLDTAPSLISTIFFSPPSFLNAATLLVTVLLGCFEMLHQDLNLSIPVSFYFSFCNGE